MKKTGIFADNYKLEKFKEKLNEKGYSDFKILTLTKETSTIIVTVPDDEVNEISKICQLVELHFKRSN